MLRASSAVSLRWLEKTMPLRGAQRRADLT
jgi:hypothetical protein